MSLQVADSLQTGTIDTPLDARTRINAISDIPNIELPYAGLIFYCAETGKHYKVTSIKSKQIGPIVQENAQIDEYETLPDEESLAEGFAPKDHTHQLSDLTGASVLPNTYAAKDHNHAETYAPKEHTHTETYAAKDHNHSETYAAKDHDHAELYAEKEHDHAEIYAGKNHSHNEDYPPLVDGKIPAQYLSLQASAHVVSDIAARDALTPGIAGERAFVRDASADETVSSGSAEYIWDGTAWIKVAESESLDLILDWLNIQNKPPAAISLPVPYDQNNNNVSLYIDIGLDPEFTEGSYTRIRMSDHYTKMKVFSNEQFHTLTEGSLGVPYYGATVCFTLDNEMMPDYSAGKTYYARYTWMDSLGASDDWKGFIFTGDIADMEPIHTEYENPPTVKEQTDASGTLTLDYLNGEIQNYTMSSDVTVNLSDVANVPFGEALICNIKRTGGTLTVVNDSSRQTYTDNKTYMVVITNFGTPLIAVTETI